MLNSTNRPALIVLLGGEAPAATYASIARLADKIITAFGTTTADDFLSGITDYDPRERKITAIKDLRDAIRFGTVEGHDGLRECKDAVESWIVRNPVLLAQWERDLLDENRDPWMRDDFTDEPPF